MRTKFKKRTGAPDHSKEECARCSVETSSTYETTDGDVCPECYRKYYRLCKRCFIVSRHNNEPHTHTLEAGCEKCMGE